MRSFSAPLGTPPPGDDNRATAYTTVEYDVGKGELATVTDMLGSVTRDIVRVRAELQEKVLRQAVIYELEKLGYIVISPEAQELD